MLAELKTRCDLCLCRAVGREFVRDQDACQPPNFEEFAEKPGRSGLVPARLNQNIQHIAICIDRANRTLQDRLVKELRIAGISNMEDGNAFLMDFMNRYNAKFAKAPAKPDNLHRALNIELDRLAEVFCLREKRYVTKDLILKYDHKRIRLEVNDLTRGLVGKYVDVYEMPDGRIQVRAKGVALPCGIIDPHQQRVTHAAITENKHPSAVLAHIKEE